MEVSVVIPLLNEEENIQQLYTKLEAVLAKLNKPYEIIFIDDGSTDNTFDILKDIHKINKNAKIIRFRRNFGKALAFSAGFDHSKGDVIITMDGDLQNDPEDIPRLLDKLDEGYDIVKGWRVNRKDPFFSKKLPSKIFNWLTSRITGVKLHDFVCALNAYRREVVENITIYGELHRYIPVLASMWGVSIAEIEIKHHPRIHGESKYKVGRLVRGTFDLITIKFLLSYSTRPLQLFGIPGVISFFIGFVIGAHLAIDRLVFGMGIGHRPLLLLAVLLIFLGAQFITMGLLGEVMARVYYEVQNKPMYAIREIID
ncbi:glycosyltransferase family 2 protein [candidate division WOR-3 bacterium]|nr:glycosyltransferase family 2 protein [candidate division WOR-3 bacterium]